MKATAGSFAVGWYNMTSFFWFTEHALSRLQHDRLNEQDARNVIADPLSIKAGKEKDMFVFRGRARDGRIIRVVLESGYRVVTAHVDRNSQVED